MILTGSSAEEGWLQQEHFYLFTPGPASITPKRAKYAAKSTVHEKAKYFVSELMTCKEIIRVTLHVACYCLREQQQQQWC